MKELLLFLAGLGLSLFTLKYSPQLKAFVKKARLEQKIYTLQKRLTNDPREAEMISETVYERVYESLNEQEREQLLDDQFVYETQKKLALQFTDHPLEANQEMVIAAINEIGGLVLEYTNACMRNDREIVLHAVKENGLALQYADESLKADLEIVLAAVKKNVTPSGYRFGNYCDNSYALQYADESLKADLDIVLVSIQENGRNALKHADDCLKRDPQIMKAVFKKSKLRLKKS